jgi:hypothetical protein
MWLAGATNVGRSRRLNQHSISTLSLELRISPCFMTNTQCVAAHLRVWPPLLQHERGAARRLTHVKRAHRAETREWLEETEESVGKDA